jgi:hypothetical protein
MISKWPLFMRLCLGIPFAIASVGVLLCGLLVGGLLCCTIVLAPIGLMLIVGCWWLCIAAFYIVMGKDHVRKKSGPQFVSGDGEPIPQEVIEQMMRQESPAVSFSNGEIIEFARARSRSNKRKSL